MGRPKNKQADEVQAEKPVETGTARIKSDEGFRVPDPVLPTYPKEEKATEPKSTKPESNGIVHVTSAHLVASLASNSADARDSRLVSLARKNRDVEWLLSEFNKTKTK